ncbi:MAG: HAMP domain-containing sensor histidine kinase [Pseudomonadota bacterium]
MQENQYDTPHQRRGDVEDTAINLSRLIYGIGHDLKAPLSSVIGLLTFCSEDLDEGNLDDLRTNLGLAMEMCARGANRVDHLLNVARQTEFEQSFSAFNLKDKISSVWTRITQPDETTTLSVEMGHTDPVLSDEAALTLTLQTLLSNALSSRDHAAVAHAITVTSKIVSSTHRDRLLISVTDTGIGVPADLQMDIFKLRQTIQDSGGLGLELYMVKRYLDRAGGDIWLDSPEPYGTCFTFELPVTSKMNG